MNIRLESETGERNGREKRERKERKEKREEKRREREREREIYIKDKSFQLSSCVLRRWCSASHAHAHAQDTTLLKITRLYLSHSSLMTVFLRGVLEKCGIKYGIAM